MGPEEIRSAIEEAMPARIADLQRLVAIPSVAFPGFDPAPVLEGANATAEILEGAGLPGVRLLEVQDGYPAVFGETPAPAGRPTILLYAHYDVQPAGPEELWSTPPFEPVVRDGRMYGRGSSDDKSGIAIHVATVQAFGGRPPVGVKVIVEGEEETTTDHLGDLIERNRDLLAADVVVVADSGNWKTGAPTLTTMIRGVVDCTIEARSLAIPVHSGSYGGAAPDALVALIRMLATLHDDRGSCAIDGLTHGPDVDAVYPEEDFRREAGMLPGVELVGEGPLPERLWTQPAVNVIGLDAPRVEDARNILVDVARARLSLRLAPGDDPSRALDRLVEHLERAAPWGVRVSIEGGQPGEGFAARTGGPAYAAAEGAMTAAYGNPPVQMGSGGSVPLIPVLARTYPDAEILLMGAMDDRSNAHAQDESVDLGELGRASLAQALLVHELAEGA